MKIFLDTSALVALYNADDANHESAESTAEAIRVGRIPLTRFYTTDYIVDEVLTYVSIMVRSHALAVKIGEALLKSPFTTVLRVDPGLFDKAWQAFKASDGLSFTDCTSFQAMKEYGIAHAFSYDRHFRAAGFMAINL